MTFLAQEGVNQKAPQAAKSSEQSAIVGRLLAFLESRRRFPGPYRAVCTLETARGPRTFGPRCATGVRRGQDHTAR